MYSWNKRILLKQYKKKNRKNVKKNKKCIFGLSGCVYVCVCVCIIEDKKKKKKECKWKKNAINLIKNQTTTHTHSQNSDREWIYIKFIQQ